MATANKEEKEKEKKKRVRQIVKHPAGPTHLDLTLSYLSSDHMHARPHHYPPLSPVIVTGRLS